MGLRFPVPGFLSDADSQGKSLDQRPSEGKAARRVGECLKRPSGRYNRKAISAHRHVSWVQNVFVSLTLTDAPVLTSDQSELRNPHFALLSEVPFAGVFAHYCSSSPLFKLLRLKESAELFLRPLEN